MNHRIPAPRPFLIACGIVLGGAAAWRLVVPKAAQGPSPVSAQSGPPQTPTSRNIIVFETDDQRWNTINLDLDYPNEQWVMPNAYDIFIDNGVYFPNAFVTNPTCCPSRASQQSGGFYSHNTGVLTNTWPNGGALRFDDENALAVRMKDTNYIPEAYYTVLIGKYMNGYEDLIAPGQNEPEKARYIPPGWDVFIVVSDLKDWDRDYKITVGGNGVQDPVGVILPDDVCLDVQGNGTCAPEDNHWENPDDETQLTLVEKLQAMGVPDDVITRLRTQHFEYVGDEDLRDLDYLPEVEASLAEAVLEGIPDPQTAPLFMMLTMAPPHGPTQLSPQYCDDEDPLIEEFEYDEDPRGGYGEGLSGYDDDDISDKPSWMQGNPDAFVAQVDCDRSLLHCYRGEGCDTVDCSGTGGDCDPEKEEGKLEYRALLRVFSDELASLRIVDDYVLSIKTKADAELEENTVFFFTSDHGTMWGEHGSFQKGIPYEEAIRVPFAVAGEGIRTGVEVSAMIAMDLDMPATILEIAGYTRNEISNPGTVVPGLIKSDGCSLLGILEAGASWGSCYTSAPSGLLPRSQILIQSFRNLAPNATPNWAGLRFPPVGSVAARKFVLTDTLEEEYYDLYPVSGSNNDYELDNLMHSDPPSDLGDLRDDIADSMGLAIVPTPRNADWNLPIAIPGEDYEVQLSTIGSSGTVTWCLWDFHDDPDPCDSCSGDLDELGCLVKDFDPNGNKDCVCYQPDPPEDELCTCECGILDWMEWESGTGTLSCDGANIPNTPGKCFQFVVAAKDSSVSPYDGRAQRIVRLLKIAIGDGYSPGEGSGFDTHVSEDDDQSAFCEETTLLASGASGARKVALIRFDRTEGVTDKKVSGGELILQAETALTDATLCYLQTQNKKCPVDLSACTNLDWEAWDGLVGSNDLVPITTVWNIQTDDIVRFDISDYLKLKRYKCGWQSHPYFEFAIISNDPSTGRGFYSVEGGDQDHFAPRLAYVYEDFESGDLFNENTKCNDCSDNECDGCVDGDDSNCGGSCGP